MGDLNFMNIILLCLGAANLALIIFLLLKDSSENKKLETEIQELKQNNQSLIQSISSSFASLNSKEDNIFQNLEKSERTFREEISRNREELGVNLKNFSTASREDLQQIRNSMESNLKNLQEENSKKLEEMRKTVDEKLQSTLEQRISLSFKTVSERLEQVHRGLGEMQNLAIGVGDLKKVLVNVKTRGTWGEVQLANLLEQILSPEQYAACVQTKPNGGERVDFAIKLPGKDDHDRPVWLPIDSKFPQEDYQRLIQAQESGNLEESELALKQLENRIKLEAKTIRDKYIEPPYTTDFAILFLPTEGLYAEMLRREGLVEKLQREFRINLVGPTTLGALLNSLQMGFKTLAIQKRSSEVWQYLADVKKHFGAFGDLLAKAYERVDQASKVIEDAGKRSRTIEAKLNKLGELTEQEVSALCQ